jgi:hypothetical protein
MGQVDLFRRLNAPLSHNRAWGAVRDDGTVVLTVWEHELREFDGAQYGQATHYDRHGDKPKPPPEHTKRIAHVELVKGGDPCLLIVNRAEEPDAVVRTVADVIEDEVFRGGRWREHDGEVFIELGDAVPVEVAARPNRPR